jgi:hypothetical protein
VALLRDVVSRCSNALRRHAGPAALVLSTAALVLSGTGLADAARKAVVGQVVRLNQAGHVPSQYLPKLAPRARSADRLGDQKASDLADGCRALTADMGTWCLMILPYPLDAADAGKNNYFYATQKCVALGGYLPTAAQLIGAAGKVQLASVIGDDDTKAWIDEVPSDGLKDRREMSATLITTSAGSSAAGSEGVSDGSTGDPRTGEPAPVPVPGNSTPSTLQYVTVFDNHDQGGFAGAKPVTAPESFRCAFGKAQGFGQAPRIDGRAADS